MTPETSR